MRYLIWLLLTLLIIFRFFTTRPVYKDGDKVRITAVIYSDPVRYPSSQYTKIAGLKVYLPSVPTLSYGDKVVVEGTVNGDRLEKPKLVSVGSGGPIPNFRNKIIDFYLNSLPQPEAGLLAGIVLGAKGGLTADFYNMTKITGVAHVVVASGTNVTFVVSFLSSILFIFLSRRRAILFVILGIILYLFMSGFEAPLVRAAIMAGLTFVAQETGRISSAWRVFFLTAGLMLIYSPDWVVDIGFLLSFTSTGAILLFQKRIDRYLVKVPAFFRKDLSTTLSAQIGVTPILFVTFGQFNIWSPLINILVLWTVPLLMVIGPVGGLIGLITESGGRLMLYLGYPLLWWFVKVVTVFS